VSGRIRTKPCGCFNGLLTKALHSRNKKLLEIGSLRIYSNMCIKHSICNMQNFRIVLLNIFVNLLNNGDLIAIVAQISHT
jgi:hypothetical protein